MIDADITPHCGLLYLSPAKAPKLNGLLKRLFIYTARPKHSVSAFFRIRKELLDITFDLSPLSKIKKLVNEILQLTEKDLTTNQAKIMSLMFLIHEIYSFPSRKVNLDFVQIGGD